MADSDVSISIMHCECSVQVITERYSNLCVLSLSTPATAIAVVKYTIHDLALVANDNIQSAHVCYVHWSGLLSYDTSDESICYFCMIISDFCIPYFYCSFPYSLLGDSDILPLV